MRLSSLPPPPPEGPRSVSRAVRAAEIIVPVDETPQLGAAPEEPVEESAEEPLPPIPPDLHGDPELDAIIARAEGRLPEDEA